MNRESTRAMDRRTFLRLVGAAGAGATVVRSPSALGAPTSGASTPTSRTPAPSPTTAKPRSFDAKGRTLVVVELAGGNDGISTVVPLSDPTYRKLRSRTLIEPAQALKVNDQYGLHPKLVKTHKLGVAVVAGVGTPNPDGSHFEMMRRWWLGDPAGNGAPRGGFLARVVDLVGVGSPVAGISLGGGAGAGLDSQRATTLSLPDLGGLELFSPSKDDQIRNAFQAAYRTMAAPPTGAAALDRRKDAALGARKALDMAKKVQAAATTAEDDGQGYPGSDLGSGLRLAARAIDANLGIRVVHVSTGGFDTHGDHLESHSTLMEDLDNAVAAFLDDAQRRGFADKVLVATTSEFGRRAADNGSDGLDHGAASVALLFGQVKPGVYGQYPSLKNLDADGNLKPTVNLAEYYATLADWLGVPADEVLASRPKAISGILR